MGGVNRITIGIVRSFRICSRFSTTGTSKSRFACKRRLSLGDQTAAICTRSLSSLRLLICGAAAIPSPTTATRVIFSLITSPALNYWYCGKCLPLESRFAPLLKGPDAFQMVARSKTQRIHLIFVSDTCLQTAIEGCSHRRLYRLRRNRAVSGQFLGDLPCSVNHAVVRNQIVNQPDSVCL